MFLIDASGPWDEPAKHCPSKFVICSSNWVIARQKKKTPSVTEWELNWTTTLSVLSSHTSSSVVPYETENSLQIYLLIFFFPCKRVVVSLPFNPSIHPFCVPPDKCFSSPSASSLLSPIFASFTDLKACYLLCLSNCPLGWKSPAESSVGQRPFCPWLQVSSYSAAHAVFVICL